MEANNSHKPSTKNVGRIKKKESLPKFSQQNPDPTGDMATFTGHTRRNALKITMFTGKIIFPWATSTLMLHGHFTTILLLTDGADSSPVLPVSNTSDKHQHAFVLQAVTERSFYYSPRLVISGFEIHVETCTLPHADCQIHYNVDHVLVIFL